MQAVWQAKLKKQTGYYYDRICKLGEHFKGRAAYSYGYVWESSIDFTDPHTTGKKLANDWAGFLSPLVRQRDDTRTQCFMTKG